MDNREFWKVYCEHLEMVAGLAGGFFDSLPTIAILNILLGDTLSIRY